MEKAVTSRATERLEKIWKDKNEDYEEDKKHKFVKNVLLTWSSVWKMYFFLKKKKKSQAFPFTIHLLHGMIHQNSFFIKNYIPECWTIVQQVPNSSPFHNHTLKPTGNKEAK